MNEAEIQLSIARLEIERQLKIARKNISKAKDQSEKEMIREFIRDAEDIDLLLAEYESRDGRLRKLKRIRTIGKLTRKIIGLKRKYKGINEVLKKIGDDPGV